MKKVPSKFREAVVQAPTPPEPYGYEDTPTIPLHPADKLITNTSRPLTLDEERHNQRIINEAINRACSLAIANKHKPKSEEVVTPEVGKGISPTPVPTRTKPLKEILGE
jgi:hypothetical protein